MRGKTLTRCRILRVTLAAVLIATACTNRPAQHQNSDLPLPLRSVGEVPLSGDSSRFDYASLDEQRGLLFIAHLGASEVVEVDIHANRVVRTIPNLSQEAVAPGVGSGSPSAKGPRYLPCRATFVLTGPD
ncbi:hypothetical protein [Mycobacterium sp.]|jgi:hypothetical protein|uniref:hypothetical protein n=1 Tax=Mycobacterium sp. TaxID=1785 RepID=UPI003C7193E6